MVILPLPTPAQFTTILYLCLLATKDDVIALALYCGNVYNCIRYTILFDVCHYMRMPESYM